MATILKETTVFKDKLVIRKGEIESMGQKFSRLRINREDAAAVLLLNTETGKVILTRQFRYAIAARADKPILEIVAGKVSDDEDPLQAAIREVEEEAGYRIKPENLDVLLSCFASPGYSSERFFIFYAKVTNANKVSVGGGIASEHENIEVVEMDLPEFIENVKGGYIADAKTNIAGMYLLLHKMLS